MALFPSTKLWSPEEKFICSLLRRTPTPPPSSLLQIHAFLLTRSLLSNLHLLTLLLSSLASSTPSLLSHARQLFDRRPNQDTVLSNSMIRSLTQNRHHHQSLSLYKDLKKESLFPFSPDTYTFPFLLKSCVYLHRLDGHQLHTHVVKMGFCYNPFTCTGLVDMYAKFGDMGLARKVFDEMPERSLAAWTSVAVGYARSGDVGSAVEVFKVMPEKDTVAVNAMIDVLVKNGDVGSARGLFDEMESRNVVSWTSLIDGYCKVGDMEAARLLFEEMPEKNVFTWNAMIGGYCQNRQANQAIELFRELQSGSWLFRPDEVTVVSVMPAISSMGAIDLGRWIHNYVRRTGLDRSTSVSTALVDMYLKCGDVGEARGVFDSISKKEVASWNAMINGLAVNGRAKEALDVFMEMNRDGHHPNDITMIGVLSACSHGGFIDEGKRWFQEMEVLGIDRKVEHYGCMVDLLGRGGYLDEAERLIHEMPFEANGIILSSLLFACGCHGDVSRAESVMKMATRIEPGNVRNFVIMRNLYVGEKKWENAERMKELTMRYGGKKEAGCSVIEVGRRVWEFVSGDRVHPELELIYRVLGHLRLNMMDNSEDYLELEMIC